MSLMDVEKVPEYRLTGTTDVDPPPSYDSVFGKLRDVHHKSNSGVEFLKTAFNLITSSVGCIVCLWIFLFIPICNIVIGSIYIRSCPIERMIPVYLIVSGILGMIHNASGIVQRIKQRSRETETEHGDIERKPNPVISAFNSLLICFIFVWFIAGNVWIYSAYNDIVTDARQRTSFRYCDQTLYYYAFWTATAAYVLVGFSCCFIIFGGLCVTCFVRNSRFENFRT